MDMKVMERDRPSAADAQRALLEGQAALKAGDKERGADCFAIAARFHGPNRATLLQMATTLYLTQKLFDRLGPIALDFAEANPEKTQMIAEIAMKVDVEIAHGLLPYLDPKNPQQMHVASDIYRRLGDPQGQFDAIARGLAHSPNDLALRIARYTTARIVADFKAMRELDALAESDDTNYYHLVLRNNLALNRLYWCEDESLLKGPARDAPLLTGKNPRGRRAIKSEGEKLHIGYVSNDFGQHIVSSVLLPLLKAHDRVSFDLSLFCYSDEKNRAAQHNWPDDLREAVVPIEDLSDEAVVALIAERGVDILVDLKGHTREARHRIFTLTEAPLTATYLGYPGTVYGVGIDYLISDRIVTPVEAAPNYHEALCRLPETQMPNDTIAAFPLTPIKRCDVGLPQDAFVFGAFNAVHKNNARSFDLWLRILARTEGTVLWVRAGPQSWRENLLAEAAVLGIGTERLVFFDQRFDFNGYLGALALADIALDTLPYNGHSTTADILRAGTPLVTTRGKAYHSRVSYSLLSMFGLSELAADDDEGFVDLAVSLAQDRDRVAGLRQTIIAQREDAALFSPTRMARHIEAAYTMMADRARRGLPPALIDVPRIA